MVDTYDGFISYSRAAGGLLAPRLQAGLQRFAKPWWKRRAVVGELWHLAELPLQDRGQGGVFCPRPLLQSNICSIR